MIGYKFINSLSEKYEEQLRQTEPLYNESRINYDVSVFESGAKSGIASLLQTLLTMDEDLTDIFLDEVLGDLDEMLKHNKDV